MTRRMQPVPDRSLSVLVVVEQLRRRVPGGIGAHARGLLGGLAGLSEDGEAVDVTLLASRAPRGGGRRRSGGPRVAIAVVAVAGPTAHARLGPSPRPCAHRVRRGALGVDGGTLPIAHAGRSTGAHGARPGVATASRGHHGARGAVARSGFRPGPAVGRAHRRPSATRRRRRGGLRGRRGSDHGRAERGRPPPTARRCRGGRAPRSSGDSWSVPPRRGHARATKEPGATRARLRRGASLPARSLAPGRRRTDGMGQSTC